MNAEKEAEEEINGRSRSEVNGSADWSITDDGSNWAKQFELNMGGIPLSGQLRRVNQLSSWLTSTLNTRIVTLCEHTRPLLDLFLLMSHHRRRRNFLRLLVRLHIGLSRESKVTGIGRAQWILNHLEIRTLNHRLAQ